MYLRQALDVLEGLMFSGEDDTRDLSPLHMSRLIVFAIMWSLGALLELDDRWRLQEFLTSHDSGLDLPPCSGDDTMFEFLVNDEGEWEHWNNRVGYHNDHCLS